MAHVIVLEDDPDLGPLLQASLEEEGHSVELHVGSAAAVSAYERNPADILIADVIIKQKDSTSPEGGILAASRIKWLAHKMRRKVRIIAISGYFAQEGMVNVLHIMRDLGADAILEKPFKPEELIEKINDLL